MAAVPLLAAAPEEELLRLGLVAERTVPSAETVRLEAFCSTAEGLTAATAAVTAATSVSKEEEADTQLLGAAADRVTFQSVPAVSILLLPAPPPEEEAGTARQPQDRRRRGRSLREVSTEAAVRSLPLLMSPVAASHSSSLASRHRLLGTVDAELALPGACPREKRMERSILPGEEKGGLGTAVGRDEEPGSLVAAALAALLLSALGIGGGLLAALLERGDAALLEAGEDRDEEAGVAAAVCPAGVCPGVPAAVPAGLDKPVAPAV